MGVRFTTAKVAVFAATLAAVGSAPAPASSRPVRAAVIVQGRSPAVAAEAVRAAGGRVRVPLPIVDGVSAVVPAEALAALAQAPGIRAVTPDEPMHLASTPDADNDVNTVNSVFARELHADSLWAEGVDGRGIRVALVDTGITPVADLTGRIVPVPDPIDKTKTAPCVNFSGESSCDDHYGHGTFIAGLIAGNGAASGGVYTGVAPRADLVSLKIAGYDGSADVTKVLAAVQWVVSFAPQLNIRVLNLSLGTNSKVSWRFDPLNLAVQRAWDSGIAVVVSASNRGPGRGTISKPADDPLVITVGAVDDRETPAIDDDRLPFFSGRGPAFAGVAGLQHPKPDVVAPGGRVVSLRAPNTYIDEHAPSTFPLADYRRGSGTSMAAGITSGVAALILQSHPTWSPNRLKFALMNTTRKVAEDDPNGIGRGLIDAYAAARNAPPGLANGKYTDRSDGSGSLDGSRADVIVSSVCMPLENLLDPNCDKLHGNETGQGNWWNPSQYRDTPWTAETWYQSQWVAGMAGSSWFGSSWYGCDPPSPDVKTCWYGSSWFGSSWFGSTDATPYGTSMAGSSWFGAWG